MSDRDYVLGTHDAEIERLGFQHQVWREHALDAWRRAGITTGQTVIDVGAGPGYASEDLAKIVGESGQVIAVERSRRFLDALTARTRRHRLHNVSTIEVDVVDATFGEAVADAAWCRWVLSFVREPKAVIGHLARALKPGGVAVFHEYLDYRSWRLAPRSTMFERFVDAVIDSVRAEGGKIDSGLALRHHLADAGFEIRSARPIIEIVPPGNAFWQWPASFVASFLERLLASGRLTAQDAADTRAALTAAKADRRSLMVTPLVLEIVARKR
ncbi:MAG: methyltransferase domain-containing protein [Alphaproteobacteria bacterium]|nr:methyltransferase domain-containing protein [Alphaproteobacteria bacterium]